MFPPSWWPEARYYVGSDHPGAEGGRWQSSSSGERVPAHVVGVANLLIEELIEQTNLDPNRGEDTTAS